MAGLMTRAKRTITMADGSNGVKAGPRSNRRAKLANTAVTTRIMSATRRNRLRIWTGAFTRLRWASQPGTILPSVASRVPGRSPDDIPSLVKKGANWRPRGGDRPGGLVHARARETPGAG